MKSVFKEADWRRKGALIVGEEGVYPIVHPISLYIVYIITQKMKFSINDFFSKCDQIRSFLRIYAVYLENALEFFN